jgi:hypothetical protein
MNNGGDDDAKGSDSSASASTSVTAVEGHRDGDQTKTIETTACKEPQESYNDPAKIQIPDFQFKYISSVKSCLQAAGWKVKVRSEDENTYGRARSWSSSRRPARTWTPRTCPRSS